MTKEQLAATLNGRQYGSEISPEEEEQAKRDGLVVVFGESNDIVKFAGAIQDKGYCNKCRTTSYVCCYDSTVGGRCKTCAYSERDCVTIKTTLRGSWSYKTDIPHETFNIHKNGELYCVGIVYDIRRLKGETSNDV